jgi:hypothetical protein
MPPPPLFTRYDKARLQNLIFKISTGEIPFAFNASEFKLVNLDGILRRMITRRYFFFCIDQLAHGLGDDFPIRWEEHGLCHQPFINGKKTFSVVFLDRIAIIGAPDFKRKSRKIGNFSLIVVQNRLPEFAPVLTITGILFSG